MKTKLSVLFFLPLTCLLLSAPLSAWDDDEEWEEEEGRGCSYCHEPDNTYLHDEADWPSKIQDPLIDSLMK